MLMQAELLQATGDTTSAVQTLEQMLAQEFTGPEGGLGQEACQRLLALHQTPGQEAQQKRYLQLIIDRFANDDDGAGARASLQLLRLHEADRQWKEVLDCLRRIRASFRGSEGQYMKQAEDEAQRLFAAHPMELAAIPPQASRRKRAPKTGLYSIELLCQLECSTMHINDLQILFAVSSRRRHR
jgi:hypothetical protein